MLVLIASAVKQYPKSSTFFKRATPRVWQMLTFSVVLTLTSSNFVRAEPTQDWVRGVNVRFWVTEGKRLTGLNSPAQRSITCAINKSKRKQHLNPGKQKLSNSALVLLLMCAVVSCFCFTIVTCFLFLFWGTWTHVCGFRLLLILQQCFRRVQRVGLVLLCSYRPSLLRTRIDSAVHSFVSQVANRGLPFVLCSVLIMIQLLLPNSFVFEPRKGGVFCLKS